MRNTVHLNIRPCFFGTGQEKLRKFVSGSKKAWSGFKKQGLVPKKNGPVYKTAKICKKITQ